MELFSLITIVLCLLISFIEALNFKLLLFFIWLILIDYLLLKSGPTIFFLDVFFSGCLCIFLYVLMGKVKKIKTKVNISYWIKMPLFLVLVFFLLMRIGIKDSLEGFQLKVIDAPNIHYILFGNDLVLELVLLTILIVFSMMFFIFKNKKV